MKLSDLIFEEAIRFDEKEVAKALQALDDRELVELSEVSVFLDEKVVEEAYRRGL